MDKILIIEDDLGIAEIQRDYLQMEGYSVTIVTDGLSGIQAGQTGEYSLILLDLMLPGVDGFQVCAQLRAKVDIPILMVTARLEDSDKIRGLGLGADDYIEKPFVPSVLVARVKAHLARYARLKGGQHTSSVLGSGELTIDPETRSVHLGQKEVELKNKEYELLLFLARHPNMVFDRETLYERIWGLDAMGDNITVAVHINRLRDKLEEDPANPNYIQTVRGAGYRFNKP
jgi:DNA-binding response OmpR family regulator